MPTKVLIVEDEPDIQEFERYLLEELLGCEAMVVSSGEEALAIIAGQPLSLVLLDIDLPGIDGIAVAKEIRADPQIKETPILAVSGFPRLNDRNRAWAAGCNDLLAKPFELDVFQQKIFSLISAA